MSARDVAEPAAASGVDVAQIPSLRTPAAALKRAGLKRFGNLPLSWKLLAPSLALIVVLGAVGGFVVVRDLAVRSQAALDVELSRRSLDARSTLRDRELYLIESANFASNIAGMAPAIASKDSAGVTRLLRSVLALKTEMEVLAVTDARGRPLVEFERTAPGERPQPAGDARWESRDFIIQALRDSTAGKSGGFVTAGDRAFLGIAAPVCSGKSKCAPVGAAVVGIGLDTLAADLARNLGKPAAGLTFFDQNGRALATAGSVPPRRLPAMATATTDAVRVRQHAGAEEVVTLYVPLTVGTRKAGTFGLSLRTEPVLGTVRRTGIELGLVLLAAIVGILAIGAMTSRLTLRQVRSLVTTNRALGKGDLSARAAVESHDELGELGLRVNEMAEQLQAMYETLELQVAQRTEEVERLLRERTEFFAAVSHELRTPLAVILRYGEMLLDPAHRNNRRLGAEAGRALEDSGGQLERLINDILEIADVERGELEVDLQTLDLGDVIRDMRRTIEPLARAAGLQLTVRIPRDLPPVLGDPRRLRQIVLNLVDNAVKYTPEGGRVELAAEAIHDFVEVRVTDTGVGVPPEVGDRIFEPFYRVKGNTPRQGRSSSGLGLAIARRLVEAHAGSIRYVSKRDAGTTFTFTLIQAGVGGVRSGGDRHGRRRA